MTKDNDLLKKLRLKRERCHDLSGVYYTEDADCQAAADRIEELEAEKDWYRDHIVWGFYEDGEPKYYQGKAGEHEICDPVTAKEVTCLLSKLNNAEAALEEMREQLEAARLDAKEAEAYSVWLEKQLAKAVKALDRIAGKVPYADDPYDIARTALAELKGVKP